MYACMREVYELRSHMSWLDGLSLVPSYQCGQGEVMCCVGIVTITAGKVMSLDAKTSQVFISLGECLSIRWPRLPSCCINLAPSPTPSPPRLLSPLHFTSSTLSSPLLASPLLLALSLFVSTVQFVPLGLEWLQYSCVRIGGLDWEALRLDESVIGERER